MSVAVAISETFVDRLTDLVASVPGEPDFVAELRRRGHARFAKVGLPSPRQEEWRFTNLKRLLDLPVESAPVATADVSPWRLADAHVLVLVNGRFDADSSVLGELPDGLTVMPLARALVERPQELESVLGRHVLIEDHPFAALNSASFSDGAYIHVARGTVVERPIQVLHVAVGGDHPILIAPRVLMCAEETAELTVVEQYVGTGRDTLTIPVTELQIAPSAVVHHVRLQEEGRSASHIGLQQAWLDRDGHLESTAVNLGGGLFRADVDAVLAGPGGHATLDGLYLVEAEQHSDTQMRVRHAAPHCTSHELYKGILDGVARAVFNGRIVVDPGAQKTDAIQSNRNLLLSDGALAFSNPQLEIFADDVRCTHGSTVGRLDENAVFYLRSRGLDRAAAESLLTYAFASEIVQKIPVEAVRERLERFLFERLPQGEVVREAF